MAKLLRVTDHDHHRLLQLAAQAGTSPAETLTDLLDRDAPVPGEAPLPEEDPRRELRRLRRILNTPAYRPFLDAVKAEAAHQASRQHEYADEEKSPEAWYNLLAWLSDKARMAHEDGDYQKALHHTISSAAMLYHWHAAVTADEANAAAPADPNPTRSTDTER